MERKVLLREMCCVRDGCGIEGLGMMRVVVGR
jgi:hypothetical protein